MRARHPEHLSTFSYLGCHRYSLCFCTDGRRVVFDSRATVDLVLQQIARAAREIQFAVFAYCLMPDHLHLLVEGETQTSDCKPFIARSKQYSGYYFAQQFGVRLWQRYGFERVLRKDEATTVVARYILENPMRAGLCARVSGYPFVGSLKYELDALIEFAYSQSG
jgi:REP-associated tyrosine transposase